MQDEVWRAVPGYEGVYEVSNMGRVRSLLRRVDAEGVTGGPRHYKSRVLRPGVVRGYESVRLSTQEGYASFKVHTLVLLAFKGPKPHGLVCRHLNGVKRDNRPENLEWGTHAENGEDAVRLGEKPRGENHHNAKLTDEQAAGFRDVMRGHCPPGAIKQLAKILNVSPTQLHNLRHGATRVYAEGAHDNKPVKRVKVKLNEDAVRDIRASPKSLRQLAQDYGVNPVTIWEARTGKSWKHLDERPAK